MPDKHDVRRIVLAFEGAVEAGDDSFTFERDGRGFAWPYPERVHPKKARVPRYDQFVVRVADADEKESLLAGEPEAFFTTDHYAGYGGLIVRLDAIDVNRLEEVLRDAWAAAPLSSRLKRAV